MGIYFSYLFFIVCNLLLFFLFPTWARNAVLVWLFVLYCSRYFLLAPSSNISLGIWTHSLCLNFTFTFEYSTHSSSVLGRHVFNQSLPILEYFVLFWTSQTPLHSHFHVGFTFYLRALLISCSTFFICLRDSLHTSLSALNILSLFFLCVA